MIDFSKIKRGVHPTAAPMRCRERALHSNASTPQAAAPIAAIAKQEQRWYRFAIHRCRERQRGILVANRGILIYKITP